MLKLHPKTLFVGQNQVFLPNCHSTNDIASQLTERDDNYDGLLVYTDFQSAGRGQRGTVWLAEPGQNVMMSVVLNTSYLSVNKQFDLSIATALGVYSGLNSLGVQDLSIKWPNDIYWQDKKLGGILIESSIREGKLKSSIMGIGLNVNQRDHLPERAVSLALAGYNYSRDEVICALCEGLEKHVLLLKKGYDLKQEYYRVLLGYQKERSFLSEGVTFQGVITGIGERGELLITSDHSKKKFDIKEISFCF